MPTGQLLRTLQEKTGDLRYKEVKNRLMMGEAVKELENKDGV